MGSRKSIDSSLVMNILPPRMLEDRRWTVEAVREGRIKEVIGQTFTTKEQAWNFYLGLVNGSQSEVGNQWEVRSCEQAQEDSSGKEQQHSSVCI